MNARDFERSDHSCKLQTEPQCFARVAVMSPNPVHTCTPKTLIKGERRETLRFHQMTTSQKHQWHIFEPGGGLLCHTRCDGGGEGCLLYLFHDLLPIRQLVDQSLDDLEQRFGLWSCCLLNSAKQAKTGWGYTRRKKDFSAASLSCVIRHDETWCSYWDCGCESPLRRFMTRVPRIMARLVRPTPTWQLKRSVGSFRGALRPIDKLVLSWKTHGEERFSLVAECKTFKQTKEVREFSG